jgi:hypothetical protein
MMVAQEVIMQPGNDVRRAKLARLVYLIAFTIVPVTAGASIVKVSPNLHIITAPATVGANFLVDQGLPSEVVFDELQDFTLTSSLAVDKGSTVPAGKKVSSYFFALNSTTGTVVNSSITFNAAVLGVIYLDGSPNFKLSDFLGAPGTTYKESTCFYCGFESGDTASFTGDEVFFHNAFSEPGDFARVIVAATVPEPATAALLATALLGLGTVRWLRRKRAS